MELEKLKNNFIKYADSFLTGDEDFDFNIKIKRDHSINVAMHSVNICKDESCDENSRKLADAIGLLHDIARFEQYTQFETFNDAASFDHGQKGVEILESTEFKNYFKSEDVEIVKKCLFFHNKIDFEKTDERIDFFIRLIRDADKLDIFRVILEKLNMKTGPSLTHHLPDSDDYSDEIVDAILEGRQICYSKRKTQNDMKLTVLNWIQDLNFRYSYEYTLENNIISKLLKKLPDDEKIRSVGNYLTKKAKSFL